MDYHELISLWKSSDKELENTIKINKILFKEVSLKKIKSNLYEIRFSNLIELLANSIFLFILTGFFIDHYASFKFSLPAALLIGISIFSLLFNIYQLYLFNRIDSRYSVVETQKTIEKLKYYEKLDVNILLVIIPLFSTAFIIVAAKALFNFNLYSLGNGLIQFTAGSVVVALIIVFFLKKFPNKHLMESITFLREIEEIEDQK